MSAAREAVVLPLMLLTAALLASVEPGARLAFVPPSPYSLVLAALLVAALARSGGLDPLLLMSQSRSMLANANGAVILAALVAASGSVLTAITPRSGLPRFFVATFLLVLLVNTMVARPDRVRLLRSLAVILGAGVVIKFVILAGLSEPATSTTARVLIAVFDAATFGGIAQEPQSPAAGYLALASCALLLAAAALLPSSRRVELATASRMQLPVA